jgi:hypothetical protein
MSDERQLRIIGFVSGRPDEQEKQKSNIKKFYISQGYPDNGLEFSPDWHKMNNDLESGDYIIIDDLTDLSGNLEELVARLRVPLKKGVHVEPVNKEHWKLLKWDERLENIEKERVTEERTLLGLKDDLAKQIFPDTES